ncbi:MAG: glutamate 5-kinase [Desulfobulbus propionicus]|nr:MAG: glutamate 5-kinase [Desulfobulbus propionicus]
MTLQTSKEEGLYLRQTFFDQAKRVVVKVGSAVLTSAGGLNLETVDNLARQIAFLWSTGREVILVSSGAVAAGRQRLGVVRSAHEPLRVKQALAATGQGLLMQAYEQAFARQERVVAQVLLTHSDLSHRRRYLNVRNTIQTLFAFDTLPIINENDTVSTKELKFSDNDTLGAMIANMIGADMYIILSDVECLYTGDPARDASARPVPTVKRITRAIEAMAGREGNAAGTGGMLTKIQAAKMVSASGCSCFIGSGRAPDILTDLLSSKMAGTFFLPSGDRLNSRKHWIAYVLKPEGALVLDDGACRALREKGTSLLPSGIVEVQGSFPVGSPVHCLDAAGTVVAAGLSNYSAADVQKIKGCRSAHIEQILGFRDADEVIHRDNLVLMHDSPVEG